MRPGISVSAMAISLRPQSASAQVGDVEIGEVQRVWYGVHGQSFRQRATWPREGGSARLVSREQVTVNERRWNWKPEPGGAGCRVATLLRSPGHAYPFAPPDLGRNVHCTHRRRWHHEHAPAGLAGAAARDRRSRVRPRRACPYDYEEVDYSADSPTRPRLLEVNPLGQVPGAGAARRPGAHREPRDRALTCNDLTPAAPLVPPPGDPRARRSTAGPCSWSPRSTPRSPTATTRRSGSAATRRRPRRCARAPIAHRETLLAAAGAGLRARRGSSASASARSTSTSR